MANSGTSAGIVGPLVSRPPRLRDVELPLRLSLIGARVCDRQKSVCHLLPDRPLGRKRPSGTQLACHGAGDRVNRVTEEFRGRLATAWVVRSGNEEWSGVGHGTTKGSINQRDKRSHDNHHEPRRRHKTEHDKKPQIQAGSTRRPKRIQGTEQRAEFTSGLESGFRGRSPCQMSTHAKVTGIAQTAAGTARSGIGPRARSGWVSSQQRAYPVGTTHPGFGIAG